MPYHLAQVNISRLIAPLDSPRLAEFVAALDPVNAIADTSPGFIWRLQTEDGNATAVRAFEWDAGTSVGVIVNLSVWQSIEELGAFAYSGAHIAVLRRRRQWFDPAREAMSVMWWIPAGDQPTTDDAEARLRHLREHGPTEYAFSLQKPFPSPDAPDSIVPSDDSWFCPA